ncbi:MAG: permease [Rhodobacteraceae bacterium]|nr:permease [Paracoccaceae bacterium]
MSDQTSPLPRNSPKILSPLWSPWGMIVLILALIALLDPSRMAELVSIAIRALGSTAPYILFAVITIAYLSASGAEAIIANVFKGREYRMIVLAALVGGLAPFCSCEVIPFIAGLLAMGVPLGPVMAFWLASPLVDPPSLLITAGALGWNFAIAKAVVAVLLGLTGGFIVSFLVKSGAYKDVLRPRKSAGCGCGPSAIDQKPVWKFWTEAPRRITFKSVGKENMLFLLKWMSLAYLIEALMIAYIPADLIASVLGGEGPKPVILSALIGAPAYLNGYIAPPLLAGLMEQGMTAGAAMAFMVAGAVSSIPAMTAVWSLVKPRVFFTYMSLGIFGAMAAGFAYGAIA